MPLTDEDVYTLLGDAEIRRGQGETDMPDYEYDLAERIARTLGNAALAERVIELRNKAPNDGGNPRERSAAK